MAESSADSKVYDVEHYNLDVIISVGYRVKSQRGVEFRKWANSVLKKYIIKGYTVNTNRINQLGEVIRIMKRTENYNYTFGDFLVKDYTFEKNMVY